MRVHVRVESSMIFRLDDEEKTQLDCIVMTTLIPAITYKSPDDISHERTDVEQSCCNNPVDEAQLDERDNVTGATGDLQP